MGSEKEEVTFINFVKKTKITPPLDENFSPLVLANHAFLEEVQSSGKSVPLIIALERKDSISVFKTRVFPEDSKQTKANLDYVERLIKTLLWMQGGWKVTIGGPRSIGEYIQKIYTHGGKRAFDVELMERVYDKSFTIEIIDAEYAPEPKEDTKPLGHHMNGCRIGFDLGASDWKLAAVADGEVVLTKEILWNPSEQSDPQYHYNMIMAGLKEVASHLPRVDCIGGSAAGIYVDNLVRVASLFRGVPNDIFEEKVKNIFIRMQKEWNIPLEVMNDGEVSALAGSMLLNRNCVLGIAMGSSEAGGYVDEKGNLTSWLNELAFVPIDLQRDAPKEEWSGDKGVGASYLSQQAVIRLAPKVGITLGENQTLAQKLKFIQNMLSNGDERPKLIFETIGCYLGYAIAHYAYFYDLHYIILLGRVTSGKGGAIILQKAHEVLERTFPDLAKKIILRLPSEKERRIGQAVAAASLPLI